jgi:hypothetical protein
VIRRICESLCATAALLFAGRSGGLRAIGGGEPDFLTGFSTHGVDVTKANHSSFTVQPHSLSDCRRPL